jgi:hypothetical protein
MVFCDAAPLITGMNTLHLEEKNLNICQQSITDTGEAETK